LDTPLKADFFSPLEGIVAPVPMLALLPRL
jgi:hypothetical protein